eukprot:jgi/Mesvir1/3505/Mv11987-RA.1
MGSICDISATRTGRVGNAQPLEPIERSLSDDDTSSNGHAASGPLVEDLSMDSSVINFEEFSWQALSSSRRALEWVVRGSIYLESATGGALTTVMFTFMMETVRPDIAATHYAALASLEVAGKASAGLLAGPLAEAVGYCGAFTMSVCFSAAFWFLTLCVP